MRLNTCPALCDGAGPWNSPTCSQCLANTRKLASLAALRHRWGQHQIEFRLLWVYIVNARPQLRNSSWNIERARPLPGGHVPPLWWAEFQHMWECLVFSQALGNERETVINSFDEVHCCFPNCFALDVLCPEFLSSLCDYKVVSENKWKLVQ